MLRGLRRLFLVGLIAVVATIAVQSVRSRRIASSASSDPGAPQWPPIRIADDFADDLSDGATAATTWVAPENGACPDGYLIKANANSGIFHVPGGRFYDRTVPERCYADAADAAADGYRAAKA
jgi:hypothetical protein